MKPAFVVTLLFSLFLAGPMRTEGQDTPAGRRAAATNHLKQVAAEISERCLDEIQTLQDWQTRRPELRRQLLDMLGLDPFPTRTPLQAEITGVLERPKYRIEKVVFQSLPGLFVTGNFYVPNELKGPLPTVLYLCGHSPHPLGAKFNYQDRAQWFAAHGFACLVLDTLEFGEVPGIHHGLHDLNMWHWLSLGYTPAGTEVWNAVRALDYLETRPEVDPKRIGLTGISGGGAITWYTAAVDERIAAAAPVCSTITYGTQARHWRAFGQCDCIYYHNTYQFDFPVVGALIAPRPLLILSGRRDADFPPDGYHEVFRRAKRVFDLTAVDDAERIREVDDEVGHTDAPLFLTEARQWMWRWLKDGAEPFPTNEFVVPRETALDLACLTNPPPDAINFSVHNRLIPTTTPMAPSSLSEWQERRTHLLEDLKAKVFRWFPKESIPFETRLSGNGAGWTPRYAEYREVTFQTERGVRIRARLLTPHDQSSDTPLLIHVKRPGDSIYFMDMDELLPLLGRCSVLILNPRFTEQSMSASELRDVQMTSAWSGRTIGTMQTWDILRTVAWAVEEGGFAEAPISVCGKGDMGVLGLYAAVLDERIDHVILNRPPGSHWEGPALLNVLRVTDIPEVAGMLSPRRLTFVNRPPVEFGLARRIYDMQGAPHHFIETDSLADAMEIWKWPLKLGPKVPR